MGGQPGQEIKGMKQVLIIAEAGVNHNGDIKLAKELINAASEANADVVKFQTFIAENVATSSAQKAEYQLKTHGSADTQYEMLKSLELSRDAHYELIEYCSKKHIQFCSTAFDLESVEFLKELKLPFWKIPSGEITNLPYLRKIGGYNEKIIISTGMAYLHEIGQAIDILHKSGTQHDKITVLHCNTEYPTPIEDVNLRAMITIRDAFKVKVGYSDHTTGIEVPIAATVLGAYVIEKHFTIDKMLSGPDHKASLEPEELKAMVCAIRNIEQSMGDGIKQPTASESKNITVARKSITAGRSIKEGEVFSEANLTVKRPGIGISPVLWDHYIGRIADRDYNEEELIV